MNYSSSLYLHISTINHRIQPQTWGNFAIFFLGPHPLWSTHPVGGSAEAVFTAVLPLELHHLVAAVLGAVGSPGRNTGWTWHDMAWLMGSSGAFFRNSWWTLEDFNGFDDFLDRNGGFRSCLYAARRLGFCIQNQKLLSIRWQAITNWIQVLGTLQS